MESCPQCSSDHFVRDGFIGTRQQYQCKSCDYRFTVSYRRGMSAEVKQLAVDMYLEGLGFRSIGRILKCSHVSVYKWVKKAGQETEKRQKQAENEPPEEVEIDEMHSFVGSKDQALLDMDSSVPNTEAIHRLRYWRPVSDDGK